MKVNKTDQKGVSRRPTLRPRGLTERPGGNPFGILSPTKTPQEIFQELVETRGLSPYQVRFALEGNEVELVVGPFVIENPLGNSPSGECSLALLVRSGESVSLRCFPVSLNDGEKRLTDSLQRAREVEHPGFQRALQVGRHDGRIYIAHEFLPGEDLDRYVNRNGRLLPQQAVDCIEQAAMALQVAQRKGLIHGDLRPSKIVVDREGRVAIREIATANFMRQRRQESGNVAALLEKMPVGHVRCAAPEAFLPKATVDFRSDIYSLGCILHFLLTGKHVFADAEAGRVIVAHRSAGVPSVSGKLNRIPLPVDRLLKRMLAKSPGDRFNSYGEFLQALGTVQSSLGKRPGDVRQSWWRRLDESWSNGYQKAPKKLRRFKTAHTIWVSAVSLAVVAVATFWLRQSFPQKGDPSTLQPATVMNAENSDSMREAFGGDDDVRREVVTVEADEVFRLP